MVQIGQLDEDLSRQLLGAGLDIAVLALGDANGVRYLLLGHVVVFSHIFHSISHASFTTLVQIA